MIDKEMRNKITKGVVAAVGGFGIFCAMALINRNVENRRHEAAVRDFGNNNQSIQTTIAELRVANDALRGQLTEQAGQIIHYRELCDRIKREYDLTNAENSELSLEVSKLIAEINRVEEGSSANDESAVSYKRRKTS